MSSRLLNIRKRVYPWERHRGSVELATSLVQHRNHLTSVRVNLCNYLLPFHGWLLSLLHSSTLPRSGTCARIHLPFVNLVGALMYAETRKLKAARLTNRLCDIDSSIDRPTYYTSFPRFPLSELRSIGFRLLADICGCMCTFDLDIYCKYSLQFSFIFISYSNSRKHLVISFFFQILFIIYDHCDCRWL